MSVSFGDGPFVEGQTYEGDDGVTYCYQDGCFIIAAPEDIDTVDGYSVPGVAPVGVVDSITGDPVEPGAPVTVFYGPDGTVTGYKDCTDADTFGVLTFATMTGVDDAGNDYVAGDPVLLLPNGERICIKKTVDTDTDTFAGLIVAGASGADAAGNDYAAGDTLIQLADGSLICAEKTIDTVDGFAMQGTSDGTQLDASGDPIPAGAPILTFFDGDGAVINSKDCTDRFTTLIEAPGDGVDSAGNDYLQGDSLLLLPNGELICAEKLRDTFSVLSDNGDGTAGILFSDGSEKTDFVCGVQSSISVDPDTGKTVIKSNDGSTLDYCPVESVSGPGVDNSDPQNPVIASSFTVPNADGSIHSITTDDGVKTDVCTDPVKSFVNNGDSTWTATTQSGVQTIVTDTFGTLVDNGDGTATISMPNGATKQIVCAPLPADIRVNGISIVETQNPDGSVSHNIELSLSDGTTLNGGPIIDRDLFGSIVDNGDGTFTSNMPGSGPVTWTEYPGLTDNADGTATDPVSGCAVSTERTSILCLAPNEPAVLRTTDLKTGADVDVPLPAMISPQRIAQTGFQIAENVTPTSANGEIIGQAAQELNFDNPCLQDILLQVTAGWDQVPGTGTNGEFAGRFRFSLNGGAFTPLSGNVASYQYDGVNLNNADQQHTQFWRLLQVPAGPVNLRFDFQFLGTNELDTGEVTNSSSIAIATYNDVLQCCDGAP